MREARVLDELFQSGRPHNGAPFHGLMALRSSQPVVTAGGAQVQAARIPERI